MTRMRTGDHREFCRVNIVHSRLQEVRVGRGRLRVVSTLFHLNNRSNERIRKRAEKKKYNKKIRCFVKMEMASFRGCFTSLFLYSSL